MLGKEVATLVNEEKPTGSYEVNFNGTALPSGIYFYKLQAGNFFRNKENDIDEIIIKGEAHYRSVPHIFSTMEEI